MLLLSVQRAEASCAVGEGGTLGVDNLGPVHIGDTITVTTVELANLLTSFQATNFNTFVVFPNNNPVQVMHVNAIPPGTSCQAGGAPFDEVCPGGSDCISFVNTYVVTFADVGKNLSFSRTVGGFTAVCNAAGVPGNIQFEEAGAGAALTGTGGTGTPVGAASLCQTILIPVIFPCISITKACDNACTPYGQPILFHGTVSNTGDSALVNVVVTDTPPAGSTSSTITFDNVQPSNRPWDGTLAAGESAVYHGSYTPPSNGGSSLCGPFTDTISATAVDVTGAALDNTTPCINPTTGVSTGTRPPVTATCLVCNNPCVQVAKNCGPAVIDVAAGTYTVSGLVTNCGNVPLTNIVVIDNITNANGVVFRVTIPLGNLDIGGSVAVPQQTISVTNCGPSSDFFSVTAGGLCGVLVSNISQTCVTVATNAACIQVSKVCGPTAIDLAAGSFIVSGSVTNCGTADLTGVVVVDTVTNANGSVDTTTITIGTVPAHSSVAIPAQTIDLTTCGTISDFFTATGSGPCGPATATSGTCVTVVTNAACVQVIKNCGPALLGLASGSYTVSGTVTNCGSQPLTGVVVTDTITNSSGVVFTIPITIGTVPAHSAVPVPQQTITVTNCGPSSDFFTVTGTSPCGPVSATSGTCVTMVTNTACLQVSKVCGPANIDLSAGSFSVSGSVSNCGTADLTGVVVVDTVTNANGSVDTTSITIGTVPAHSSVPIPAQVISLSTCGTISDFFSATGNDSCGPASATSPTCVTIVTNTACIQVGKVCGPATIQLSAGSFQVSGGVTNCGTAGLTGVTILDVVTDPHGNTTTNVVSTGGTLAPGQPAPIGPITIPITLCGPYTDYLVAIGTGPCGSVTNRSPGTCTTTVACPAPCIQVIKGITCAPAAGVAGCDGTLTYGSTATGMSGTNNSAFCYQITVTNCGNDVLTGVTVVDNLIPSVAAAFSDAATLQVGQSVTHYFGQSYGPGAHTNTVVAAGTGQTSNSNVTANASATAIVVPVSVTCQLNLTNDSQVNTSPVNGCDVELSAGTANAAIHVILTLHNTGQADLNVSVIGGSVLTTLTDCGTGTSITPPIVFVPAGQTVVTNIGCVSVSCPGATISAAVQGTGVGSASVTCVFDTFGNAIKTSVSSCENCVKCQLGNGCTPGFWKNCTQQWLNTGFSTDQSVSSVFTVQSCEGNLGSASLLQALSFKGGSGVSGAAQILLRAAVAGLLNSVKLGYPLSMDQVVMQVNGALASCDRDTILALASTIDGFNNLGCRDRNGNDLPCHATTPLSGQEVKHTATPASAREFEQQ
jgi:uncharacterized repeat protein (TIGR01451 family)